LRVYLRVYLRVWPTQPCATEQLLRVLQDRCQDSEPDSAQCGQLSGGDQQRQRHDHQGDPLHTLVGAHASAICTSLASQQCCRILRPCMQLLMQCLLQRMAWHAHSPRQHAWRGARRWHAWLLVLQPLHA